MIETPTLPVSIWTLRCAQNTLATIEATSLYPHEYLFLYSIDSFT